MSTVVAIQEDFYTLAEYLALEENSATKHEYWAGRIYAMAGGTPRHADLIGNVAATFIPRLRGRRCRGSSSEQRIRVEAADVEFYPDFVVKCPPEEYSPSDPNALTNPALVVEVLSPSSQTDDCLRDDRGEKFQQYALIPELRDYLLVSQDRVLVEHFQRVEDGWLLRSFNQREQNITISNLEIEVPLSEIYEGVDVPSGLVVTRSPEA